MKFRIYLLLLGLALPAPLHAQEIKLPEGLGSFSSLQETTETPEPFFDLSGFLEGRLGTRLQNDPLEKRTSIGEMRLQLGVEKETDNLVFNMVGDFIYDPVADQYAIDLERGQGAVDIREMNVSFSPFDFMDMKVGRQILTWGTGDLLFINDMFAKDWNSFFIGRDDEYLKAPSDAIKTAFFFGQNNLELIYMPRFDTDRYIDGTRLSFFDRGLMTPRGRNNPVIDNNPDRWFSDDEISARYYRSFGAYETAIYYYNGFWKSPAGQDRLTGNAEFPKLQVYGASLRGPVAKGIGNIEVGYYKSAEGAATNPLVRNDEFRLLVGYEQELASELTGAIQYYLERRLNYDQYISSLPIGAIRDDQYRHMITVRLTKMLMQQDLKLSLFNFYSPSDQDGYLRFNMSYKISDNLRVEGGGNLFYGKQTYSFFAQFRKGNNIYSALRYDF